MNKISPLTPIPLNRSGKCGRPKKIRRSNSEQRRTLGKFPLSYSIRELPLKKWTATSLADAVRAEGLSHNDIAKLTGVQAVDVRHFVHKRFQKISRAKAATLISWFRAKGYLREPGRKIYHCCPSCGSKHAVRMKRKKSGGAAN